VNDGFYMVDVTKESLCMGLAVNVASVIENLMAMFCREQNELLPPKEKKPGWKHIALASKGSSAVLWIDPFRGGHGSMTGVSG